MFGGVVHIDASMMPRIFFSPCSCCTYHDLTPTVTCFSVLFVMGNRNRTPDWCQDLCCLPDHSLACNVGPPWHAHKVNH
jgi:hypothetical protein